MNAAPTAGPSGGPARRSTGGRARLSDQLKHLDDAQFPGGLPGFDEEGIVRGGRRRRRRRNVLNLAGSAAAVTVIAAITFSLGPGHSPDEVTPRPAADPTPVAAVTSHDAALSYSEQGSVVTAYRSGQQIATLTLSSVTLGAATRQGANGRLTVDISAAQAFTFTAGEFIWEDPSGADTAPLDPHRVLQIAAGRQSVRIDYRQVGKGDVIWSPTGSDPAGAWLIPAGGTPTPPAGYPVNPTTGYSQAGNTLTLYRGSAIVGTVRLASATVTGTAAATGAGGQGHALLTVQAIARLTLHTGDFRWEDPQGANAQPAGGDRTIHVSAGQTQNVVLQYQKINDRRSSGQKPGEQETRTAGTGDLIWSPGTDLTVARWPIPATGPH